MKSNASVKTYLLKRREKTDGRIPVYIRITKAGKYSLQSTGISIDEKQWNPDKSEVRRNHPSYDVLNIKLQDEITRIRQVVNALPPDATLEDIRKVLDGNSKPVDFFAYTERFLIGLKNDKRYWANKHTCVTVGFFSEYLKTSDYPFNKIDHNTLEGFQRFLKDEKGNNPNTVHKHFQAMRRILVKALQDEVIQSNPFDRFKPDKRNKSEKARLSLTQVRSIEALELVPGSWLEITRDAFMFSFYNAGIRFGDVARLKWKHIIDGRLKYNMAKTGTGKNINLLNPALAILDKYRLNTPDKEAFIFPILSTGLDYSDEMFEKAQISSKNVIVNRNLKTLAYMAGIDENVSFHVARHSFADYARTSGMDIYNISKALGHADITITQAYLKSFDETSLDAEMNKLFQ